MNEFESRVHEANPEALYATGVELLQLNVGLRCNMTCAHCHQSSSPLRTEQMSDAIVDAALRLAQQLQPELVDITGGAPELHPRIRNLAVDLRSRGLDVQIRTNLTVLREPGCEDLPELWAQHGIRLLASLPSWDRAQAERQRGAEAFETSIEVLKRLNALGYGRADGLRLDLASNPDGTSLPTAADDFTARFRHELAERHGVEFNVLRVLTNMPIGRFRAELGSDRQGYLDRLRGEFNAATLPRLACRTSLVVAYDGTLYDCDFNAGAGLPLHGAHRTVRDVDDTIATRRIAFAAHCFACTARAGSS
ncbi:MAG: arsenosugar biosynthesis radical SAM protein ArsS [Deltaproteobacteria bacterium]|jgi:radical SAM/Cys-rich protein|nr:arsenosugar biosynthesis radical SAM protein ArsS [Deltaproteobacteria bacterium]MBW2533938.1 arsenosugar biosynthesis radical SAM protein ArsS [Deltaproteobacteria bacterium]